MRKIYLFLRKQVCVPVFLVFCSFSVQAQICSTNTQTGFECIRSNALFGAILPNSGCEVFTTVSGYSPGTWFRLPVLSGGCYTISTCGSPVSTWISCYQGISTTTGAFAYNNGNGPDCSGVQASVNIVPNFTDFAAIDVREGNCQPGGTQSITVKVRQNNNLQFTSSNADMCEDEIRLLTATPAPVTGVVQAGSGAPGTYSGQWVSNDTFLVDSVTGASQTFVLTYEFGYCSVDQTITVFRKPSAAQAGPDQVVCDTFATLAGTVPATGTGTWTVLSGPGTVVAPNSPTSSVTGLIPDSTLVLMWSVENGPCTINMDTVTISRQPPPSIPNAGMDQGVCDSSATLMANTPTTGTGSWSLVSGAGTITSVTSPTTTVSNLGFGANTFRWTTSNGTCQDRSDDVVVTRDMNPDQAIAGPDVTTCDTAAQLNATAPGTGTGQWSIASGGGFLVNPSNPNTLASNLTVGTNTLVWTVSNGSCPASSDTAVITRNPLPSAPTITGDTTICEGANALLTANSNAGSPAYLWWTSATGGSVVSGSATFGTPPLTDTTTYWVDVTDIQTTCASPRAPVTVYTLEPPTVSLGSDLVSCDGDTVCFDAGAGLSAYLWSTQELTQTICTDQPGNYWVIVTDTNNCQNSDTATFSTLALPMVNLGPDTVFCQGTSVTLGPIANPTLSYLWNTSATSSTISVSATGSYFLAVTDTNNCTAVDTIETTALGAPNPGFSIDVSNCPVISFTDTSLNASGWAWDFGNGLLGSTQNPSSDYTSAGNGTYTVTLVASNQCGSDSISQPVVINCLVGLEDQPQGPTVELYPNPNSGRFRVNLAGLSEKTEMVVFDLQGKVVFRQSLEDAPGSLTQELDLGNPAGGVYFFRIQSGEHLITRRFVVD